MNHENFRHDAAVYADDHEFLAMAVPFVTEGVETTLADAVLYCRRQEAVPTLR